MARRRSAAAPARKTRVRRSDEQLLQDLQKKIEQIQRRAAARQAKRAPRIRLTAQALRAIEKAREAAASEGDGALRDLLSDVREPVAGFLRELGVQLRKTRRPKGGRPKASW